MFQRILITLIALISFTACSKTTAPVSIAPEKAPVINLTSGSSGEFIIDPSQSTVEWKGKKILIPSVHTGTIAIRDGKLILEKGQLKSGSFILDMTSISDEDQEGDMRKKLEDHLKSADFFDVERFPTATLKITDAVVAQKNLTKVKADLTIKGITKPIEFDARVEATEDNLKANAEFSIDRTLWNVRYGSGKFFEGLGDKVIDDRIGFKVDWVANRQKK